jgi:hypothetical protein
MAEDNFQNQACPDYVAFDSYLNETTTFNLVTNTMTDEIFDIVRNPVYPDSVPCDSYFNGPMALNTVADGIIASTNFDVIPSQVCPCDSYFDDPMTLNTEAGNGVFPEYITCDSDGDEPLTLNAEADNQIFPDGDEPLTLNLASTVADDTFDIQNPISPDFDEPTTQGFQTWKKSWDEKMLLVQWKREGKDWEDITKSFKKMKTRNGNTRKSMLQRADSEVSLIRLGRLNARANLDNKTDRGLRKGSCS